MKSSFIRRRARFASRLRLRFLEDRITPAATLVGDLNPALLGPINRPALKDGALWDSGEAYHFGGQDVQLARRLDEVVVRVASPDWQPQGALAGFTIERTLKPTTLVLRSPAAISFVPDDTSLSGLSRASGVTWAAPVYIDIDRPDSWQIASDEVVVRLNDGLSAEQFFAGESIAQSYRPLWGTPDQFVVTIASGGAGAFAASVTLRDESGVAWAEPNFFQSWHTMYSPNDTLLGNQWHLENTGASGGKVDADVDATSAWDVTTGSSSVVIAVIDDSMQISHPDLAPNLFVNTGEIAGNTIDDDLNGWVDDVSGYDFVTYDNDPSPGVANDNHGTAVAGVIAAKGDNSLGVAGAAYSATILPIRIGLGGTFTSDADIAAAVYYAAGRTKDGTGTWNAAQITNNSWGGGGLTTPLIDSFTWASNTARGGKGVLSFIAAGNGGVGTISSPAILAGTLSGVMAIGASTNLDMRSSYSQYGTQLDLVSPSNGGTLGIQTTDRTGTDGYSSTDYTSGFGGTSSATPLAAGIGALVLSQDLNMTAAQIRSLLRNTTDLIGPLSYGATGRNNEYGHGRINANTAVRGVGVREIQVFLDAVEVPDGGELKYSTFIGTPQDYVVRVRNQGTLDLTLGSITLDPGPFSVLTSFGDSTLSVGESTTMTIRFQPTGPGSFTKALSFTNDDSDEATFDITLSGTAIAKSVSGTVFEDFNGNNVRNTGEPGLSGRKVYLDANNNNQLDAVTTSFDSVDVPKPLPDLATTTSTLTVNGLMSILDVDIKLSLNHSYDNDLVANLISPTGTKVQLFANVGGNGDHFINTVFDDEAALTISSGTAPFSAGPYQPSGLLSAFDGQDPNGTWTLEIIDSVGSDSGTLTGWSVTITSAAEESTLTVSDGSYYFPNLAFGSYTVRASTVAGWTTAPGLPVTISAATDQFPGRDFGSSRANTIYGKSYIELDGNGMPGVGEAPLPNRMVFIDANSNSTLDTSSSTITATDLPKAINDFSTATSTVTVGGLGMITDINVTLSLTHTYDADLSAYLISPSGTKVELFSNVGGNGDNFTNTVIDDEATINITAGSAPFSAGPYKPEGLLSAFDGQSANGTWSLQIVDSFAIDVGSLTAWSMDIVYATEQFTTSDANGWYSFVNLAPATYPIRIASEVGFDFIPAGGAHTVTLNTGETIFDKNFGRIVPGTTYGRLFDDVNGNGLDDSEAGMVGWTVYHDLDNNGSYPAGTPTTYSSTNVPLPVPGNSKVNSTLLIAGATTWISDLNVKMNIAHTWDADLTVTLVSPTGTRIELTSGNGSSNDNYFDTIFDDQAAGSVTAGTAPFTATFKPEQSLSVLNGTDANGTWTLEVVDAIAADSGTINSWSLDITGGEPATVTDANGYYQLPNLAAGAVNLRRVLQPGYASTSPPGGVHSFTHVNGVANLDKSFGQRLATPPTVSSVTFGDGTNQRSLVKQMVVTFNEAVNFTGAVADAFKVSRTGSGAPTGDVSITTNPVSGSASSVTITFSGALTEFDSLIDGLYDFTIDASKVSGIGGQLDGDLVGGAGGNYAVVGSIANKFFRYFGDSDGDGAVTQEPDFIEFRNAFGPPSTIFDFDNDAAVDQDDFIKFRNNFGGGP